MAALPARPGSINYFEGQASIGNRALTRNSIGSVELEPGQTLITTNGKAEVLLTPGVFMRVGRNSSVQLVTAGLTDTQVQINKGRAMIEAGEIRSRGQVRVSLDGATVALAKHGLYDFDADRAQVRVFDGELIARANDREIKIKGGHMLNVAPAMTKAVGFDKKAYEDDLYQWSSVRASSLAQANAYAAPRLAASAWYGPGWYWNPWYSYYTWFPGDPFYSPFGFGFYPPLFVYRSPVFVRPGFLRGGVVGGGFVGPRFRGGPAVGFHAGVRGGVRR
jgi:hypothetical protein